MKELAVLLNIFMIYGRACHNLTTGANFSQDHEFFGELYTFAETSYDSVIERCIGLEIDINIQEINLQAATMCSAITIGASNNEKLAGCLEIETQLVGMIDRLVSSGSCSSGTEQLVGDIANQLEMFQYKTKQRLKP